MRKRITTDQLVAFGLGGGFFGAGLGSLFSWIMPLGDMAWIGAVIFGVIGLVVIIFSTRNICAPSNQDGE